MARTGWTRSFNLHIATAMILLSGMAAAPMAAQGHPAAPRVAPAPQAPQAPMAAPVPGPVSDQDLQATQQQLIKLLRLSPTLTTVVEHDPSLLSNQDYVNRNNPQLGQFLASHPEVARNPEFYLFTHLNVEGGRDEALERAVWPETYRPWEHPSVAERLMEDLVPFLVFVGIVGALLWLTRLFLENRRWSRTFAIQNEVHTKLIEKFGANQELLTYMQTDAGKRFLEAAPIPVGLEQERVPNAVARVLTPLQIGVVLTLLGIGLLALRNSLGVDAVAPTLLIGTVVLMPGIGFIISAGITWFLAGRLGLMPDRSNGTNRLDSPFNTRERQ